jgi:hypothetical protein
MGQSVFSGANLQNFLKSQGRFGTYGLEPLKGLEPFS